MPTGVMDASIDMQEQRKDHVVLLIEDGSGTCGIYGPSEHMNGTLLWLGSLPIGPAYIITRVLGQTRTLHTGVGYKWILVSKQPTTLEHCEHLARQTIGLLRTKLSQHVGRS